MNYGRKDHRVHKGNIAVLTAFLLIVLMAMIAFAVDVGYICVVRQQLQQSADAAALAACWELLNEDAVTGQADPAIVAANARAGASRFAGMNLVMHESPQLSADDIDVGYLINPSDPSSSVVLGGLEPANAVTVRVRRSKAINGTVPLFFAKILGFSEIALEAEATAALLTDIAGFRAPSNGECVMILPFALDFDTYEEMMAGSGPNVADVFGWEGDDCNGVVNNEPDGCFEVNLFPQLETGAPGNRGTVDIGSNNNSTNDIARQILTGISFEDLEYHGGELACDEADPLLLNGDTGISAGVKDELASIIGQPRMIPIFREVYGNGNNATYEIVNFVGVRILDVKLTGSMSNKRVIIQTADFCTKGAINGFGAGYSQHIYSPVWLVR